MLNQHKGRRIGEKTGKESMPKQKEVKGSKHSKKANKKYRCCSCHKKLPVRALVEQPADKHGRVFICYSCIKDAARGD